MLLVVNIGNSNLRFGIYEDNQCHNSWVVNTKPHKSKDELMVLFENMYAQYNINKDSIKGIAIGSVVPQQTLFVQQALEQIHAIQAVVITRNIKSEVSFKSDQIGTDLYANAVAAHYKYPNCHKIVIDFGTALTFLTLHNEGNILGVSIAPGIMTSLNALVENTAQLPEIELKKPNSILGNSTETCMQSGIIFGYLSMIEGIVKRTKEEIPDDKDILVIATGGMGHIYAPLTKSISINDKLHTICGLRFLYLIANKQL